MTGQSISHYRILEKLGEGGMGIVYKAEDVKLGRVVALKFLAGQEPEQRERFVREARAAAALNHPSICTVYEVDDEHGFLAMELVEGPSLKEKITERPLRLEEALEIAGQVCEGLQAAHEKGIVHRDIKPGNILLTPKGQVKITDFGLAAIRGRTRITKSGTSLGTPGYMSPEQARGEAVDRRTDIWSLGVVLYEMVSGVLPFGRETEHAAGYAIVHETPEPLTAVRTGVPVELDRIVGKALAKDPGSRYQHADELAVDIRACRERARTTGVFQEKKISRRLAATAAAGGLIAAAGVYWAVWQERDGKPGPSIAVLPLNNLSGDREQDYFSDGITEVLINDLGSISALRVVSRTSMMRYKNSQKRMPEIARELNVSHVLEGSVLRAGNRARITAQLVDAAADRQIWSRSFERDLPDLLALQREVAREIAREVRVRLTPVEEKRLASGQPVNPAAYEAYLKGRMQWNKRTAEGLEKAIEYSNQALAVDGQYAAAYALMSDAYALLPTFAGADPNVAMPQAKRAVEKALELDADLAEAHASLGFIQRVHDWDWTGSEFHLKRAIELNPGYATAWHRYSNLLSTLGRFEESLAAIQRAEQLDPLSVPIKVIVAYALFCLGRYEEALQTGRKSLEIEPEAAVTHRTMGEIYSVQGRHKEGLEALQTALRLSRNENNYLAQIGVAHALAGRRTDAENVAARVIEAGKRRGFVPAFRIGQMYLILGQPDKGYEWMKKALETRDADMRLILSDPPLKPYRSDPQFVAISKRMGLR